MVWLYGCHNTTDEWCRRLWVWVHVKGQLSYYSIWLPYIWGSPLTFLQRPRCVISFSWAFCFSRRRLASKHRHWHIRQTIYSTSFGVRGCFLVLWSKNFQPPSPSFPKFEIFHCKVRFFVKITHFCSHSSTKVVHWIGNIVSSNPMVKSVFPKNKGFPILAYSNIKIPFYFRNIWSQRLQIWHADGVCQGPASNPTQKKWAWPWATGAP